MQYGFALSRQNGTPQWGFAVGTVIADRPPHRSVRAELPHTAPTSVGGVKPHVWKRMQNTRPRYPPVEDYA